MSCHYATITDPDYQRIVLRYEIARDLMRLKAKKLQRLLDAKYSPDQPRVPAGNPEGGQWTYVAGYARARSKERQDFANYLRTGRVQMAQNVPRGPRGGGIATRFPESTPGQQIRHAAAELAASNAVRRVRERDPDWKEPQSFRSTIEGEISHLKAATQAANAACRNQRWH